MMNNAVEAAIRPGLLYAFARQNGIALLRQEDEFALLVARETVQPSAIVEARRAVGRPVRLEILAEEDFDRALTDIYGSSQFAESYGDQQAASNDLASLAEDAQETTDLLADDNSAPVIRLINGLILEAIRRRSSDIHFEPYEDRLAIRFRIDGMLQEVLSPAKRLAPLLSSRVKVMAKLDIAEKRLPQDGRMSLSLAGRRVDVRVSTLPSHHGERVVLRLLDKERIQLTLNQLGMDDRTMQRFPHALQEPNGVILVTGPTGSGKTTTLYSALGLLNSKARNILTIEDPIEYGLEGIGQTQVNTRIGMSFAAGLRAILRQDPDIVMLGEIRDNETAEIAVQASLTGHLVLSTVHTNSSAAAITRLRDMGVESFLLASTVRAVLAQRLVRRLCSLCKRPYRPSDSQLVALGLDTGESGPFYAPVGCGACAQSGYDGRIGIFELLLIDPSIRQLVHDDASEQVIEDLAFRDGGKLLDQGAQHVRAGLTAVDEVLRACRREDGEDGGI